MLLLSYYIQENSVILCGIFYDLLLFFVHSVDSEAAIRDSILINLQTHIQIHVLINGYLLTSLEEGSFCQLVAG